MSFELGTTVGGYEFVDILDSSKAGIQYKVRNTLAERFEVLKILPGSAQEDPELAERFLREIKVHARLIHPNIVTFYNATVLNGQLVMTTEWVEGTTLAQRLEAGPIPWSEAFPLMCDALAALDCAHGHGIIHRDVTPGNMTISPEGTLRLNGFGIAKPITDQQLTQAGTVMGSLKYISPEQVKCAGEVDARSDVYSMGVVLYEVATGKVPFDVKGQFDVMFAHVNTPPKPPREINPEVPPEIERIILKALAKDPAERFQTADELRKALLRHALETTRAALQEISAEVRREAEPVAREAVHPVAAPRPVSPAAAPSFTWGPKELFGAGVLVFVVATSVFLAVLMMSKSLGQVHFW